MDQRARNTFKNRIRRLPATAISGSAAYLAEILLDWSRRDGVAHAKVETMAGAIKTSVTTARRALRELEKLGIISTVHRHNKESQYYCNHWEKWDLTGQNDRPETKARRRPSHCDYNEKSPLTDQNDRAINLTGQIDRHNYFPSERYKTGPTPARARQFYSRRTVTEKLSSAMRNLSEIRQKWPERVGRVAQAEAEIIARIREMLPGADDAMRSAALMLISGEAAAAAEVAPPGGAKAVINSACTVAAGEPLPETKPIKRATRRVIGGLT